jgi:hypothetical protein
MGLLSVFSKWQMDDLFFKWASFGSFWIENLRFLLVRTKYFCEFHSCINVANRKKLQISELLMWQMNNSDLKHNS